MYKVIKSFKVGQKRYKEGEMINGKDIVVERLNRLLELGYLQVLEFEKKQKDEPIPVKYQKKRNDTRKNSSNS